MINAHQSPKYDPHMKKSGSRNPKEFAQVLNIGGCLMGLSIKADYRLAQCRAAFKLQRIEINTFSSLKCFSRLLRRDTQNRDILL